jgi:hypothetical protein
MDHHADRPLRELERLRGAGVGDQVDHLDLEEVVPCAERTALRRAALVRAIGHRVRIRACQPAVVLAALEVRRPSEPSSERPCRALLEDASELGAVEPEDPFRADATRDPLPQPDAQLRQEVFHLRQRQIAAEQAYAAADVEPDPTGRDHAAGVHIGRGDAAHREAVAPVDVRHRVRGPDDPGKRCDVCDLLQRAIVPRLGDAGVIGEHAPRHAHTADLTDRHFPLERSNTQRLHHTSK